MRCMIVERFRGLGRTVDHFVFVTWLGAVLAMPNKAGEEETVGRRYACFSGA